MNINFEVARNLMVENQLRPNKITDPKILDLFRNTKKEDFLENEIKKISYNDSDIYVDQNRGYLKTLHIAQLVSNSEITKEDKVLHIGGLTGYVSVILANICKKLVVIEKNDKLILDFEKNINSLNIKNTKIFKSELYDGFLKESPYDIIFIDNPIDEVSEQIKNQLSNNFGKLIMIKKVGNQLCKAFKITKHNNSYTNEYLFDVFTKYELYKQSKGFIF